MHNINLLIVDDEPNLVRSLIFALKSSDIHCFAAHDGATAMELAETEQPDAVLLDVRLGEELGLELLPQLKKLLPDATIIMMSAYGDTKYVVQAIKQGAVDYLTKPFDIDELLLLLKDQLDRKKLHNEVAYYRQRHTLSSGMIGDSPVFRELAENIQRVCASAVNSLLLLGDTGVGKTQVAREIHNQSLGEAAPFVEVNCASLPAELIEAELFGAEKGAYTGSTSRRAGLVEVADKGTLFLDEIGEMPLALQAKLLTFLESRSYRPVGATREKSVDTRVIMATNRDLPALVEQGAFRSDLFYRINTFPLQIPSLSQRPQDIPLLIQYFSEYYARREGSQPVICGTGIMHTLQHYYWPGNIRELKNLMERLTILYAGKNILREHLPAEMLSNTDNVATSVTPTVKTDTIESAIGIDESLRDSERNLILNALEACHWRKGMAAQKLGISRHALKRRIQRLGIE